jgi:L-ectoine synthase
MFARTAKDLEAASRVKVLPDSIIRSERYINAADGMGFSYHLNSAGANAIAHLWYKHHWEANFVIVGQGKLTDKAEGETWSLEPGALYVVGQNDPHILEVTEGMHIASIFCPALKGDEKHDEDGAYAASGPIAATDGRMFVRHAQDMRAAGQELVVANGMARTLRMLTKSDDLGFSFSDVHFDAGATTELWYKNHWEGNYIVSGVGTVEDLTTEEIWDLAPGLLYSVGPKDRHRVTAETDIHILSVFCPPLQGNEQHDANGSLEASGPIPTGPPDY